MNRFSYFLAGNVSQLPQIALMPMMYLSLQYTFTSPRGKLSLVPSSCSYWITKNTKGIRYTKQNGHLKSVIQTCENKDVENAGSSITGRNSPKTGARCLLAAVQQHNEHTILGICNSDWMHPKNPLVVLQDICHY